MFPLFSRDVDNAPRNNKRLLPSMEPHSLRPATKLTKLGRNYCILSLFDPNNISTLSLDPPEKKSSWSRRSKKGSIKKSHSVRSTKSLPQNAILDGASDSKEIVDLPGAMTDSLQVTLRVEINHKNPEGATKPYRFIIPVLQAGQTMNLPRQVAKSI